MSNNIEELEKLYRLPEEKFSSYYERALLTLTAGKKSSNNKTLAIVGGQSGAGKSRLIPIVNSELLNNAIIVDFDELRSLNPYYKEISQNYPEITHRILHSDTEKVKDLILEYLIENEYNVIYEGALRNTNGFLEFARRFQKAGYHIRMDIMSVPKLESYGSTFYRYATALITDTTPRWVEKSAHDRII